MIPAYSETVKIVVQEQSTTPDPDKLKNLEEQVRVLRETVDYLNRERSRMKSELESLRSLLNRG
jgi:predicted RNase H-like nuclease (RuvC/YqgF family)